MCTTHVCIHHFANNTICQAILTTSSPKSQDRSATQWRTRLEGTKYKKRTARLLCGRQMRLQCGFQEAEGFSTVLGSSPLGNTRVPGRCPARQQHGENGGFVTGPGSLCTSGWAWAADLSAGCCPLVSSSSGGDQASLPPQA